MTVSKILPPALLIVMAERTANFDRICYVNNAITSVSNRFETSYNSPGVHPDLRISLVCAL